MGFIIYGAKVIRILQKSMLANKHKMLVRRMYRVTVVLSGTFVLQSCIPVVSAAESSTFFEYFELFQAVYLGLDLISLFTVGKK